MSRISDIEAARHFMVTDEEVSNRFHKLITDFGLPVHNGLDLKNLDHHKLPPEVFINTQIHGNTHGNVFKESVFFECNFFGNTLSNDFSESDFLGGSMTGRFLKNNFRGSYLRYVDISGSIFKDTPPEKKVALPDDDVVIHQNTGRIIFCSGVENSIVQPEEVATFRPIKLKLTDSEEISFLARLYYDGIHRKLGLISLQDILFNTLRGESRLWPNFIYTLTNDSKELRGIIESDFINDLKNASIDRILEQAVYEQVGQVVLRPARPLDVDFLQDNIQKIPPNLTKILHLKKKRASTK